VLAVHTHIPALWTLVMSATVFAGSAQFAAIAVVGAGGGVVAAILAGALLNLRYLAVGAAAAPSLPGNRWQRVLFGQLVVDESFALGVGAGSPGRPDGPTMLISGALFYVAWTIGTAIGLLLGPAVGDPKRLGLDAAFPALFVALLWPMLKDQAAIRAAVAGALVAIISTPFLPAGAPLALAAIAGVLLSR
jgi:predicted branched-subunit amino acid permease